MCFQHLSYLAQKKSILTNLLVLARRPLLLQCSSSALVWLHCIHQHVFLLNPSCSLTQQCDSVLSAQDSASHTAHHFWSAPKTLAEQLHRRQDCLQGAFIKTQTIIKVALAWCAASGRAAAGCCSPPHFLPPSVANSWGRRVPGLFFMGFLHTLYSGKEVALTHAKPLGQWMSCSQ